MSNLHNTMPETKTVATTTVQYSHTSYTDNEKITCRKTTANNLESDRERYVADLACEPLRPFASFQAAAFIVEAMRTVEHDHLSQVNTVVAPL